MRPSFFIAGLLAQGISANIIFNHVPLSCDRTSQAYTGCLRGQHCTENGTCEVGSGDLYPASFRPTTGELSKRDYSVNGQCGPNNGNLLCDPNATGYSGTCCSQYGWCGNTPAHCDDGCVSGCGSSSPSSSAAPTQPSSSTTPRSDGRCGHDFGGATCDPQGAYSGCCSQYGYCGSTDAHCSPANGCQSGCAGASQPSLGGSSVAQSQPPSTTTTGEPVISSPSSTSQATNGGITADGSCGQANGGTTCGNWPQGSCCSMYGYCGNTASHCGAGCQSGPCVGGAAVQAPGPSPAPANPNGGSFQIVGQSGAPAMHAGLLPNGRFFVLDKVENYTQVKLSNGQYAYSTEYDPATNTYVPLSYVNNAFCAGGSFLADGRVVSLGGNAPLPDIDPTVGNGFDAIRYLSRSSSDASLNGQGWSEPGNKLASKRWYPSAQTLPDGTVFVASGSLNGLDPTVFANNNPTWELLNSQGVSNGVSVPMDILAKNQPYYMYPFIHLMSDGNLFVFTSKSSESFNVGSNTTVKAFPDLPGDYRTYPNTGGSVMLPLSSSSQWAPDIVVCGGGAYQDITSPTDPSCGRIQPLGAGTWEMDSMPEGRGMVEGTILPDGTVIWLNGCDRGAQGYGLGASPTYEALIYDPTQPLGKRWTTGASSTIARMYHSVAFLLLDGTLLVTGSNPVEQPILQPSAQNPYVTEFRVEVYTPPYLSGDNANKRPTNVQLSSTALKANGAQFTISFTCPQGAQGVKVSLYHGGFVTHSVHMGHRMAILDNTGFNAGSASQTVTATMPPNSNVAPPGPYVVFVVVDGVPSVGQMVQVS